MAATMKVVVGVLLCLLSVSRAKISSVTYNEQQQKYEIHDKIVAGWIAWGNFTDEVTKTGWSYLEVTTNPKAADDVQAYSAGMVEGYLTEDLIYKHWMNTVEGYCKDESPYCERLQKFMKVNLAWMKKQIAASEASDPYWHQVNLVLTQLAGLENGYDQRTLATKKPSIHQLRMQSLGFIMFQIFGDLEDLEQVLNKTGELKRLKGYGSCSALIKLTADHQNLFVSQVSWNTYQSMLRVLKRYNLAYRKTADKSSSLIPAQSATFSSYPGLLGSGDDFYILSSRLSTLETTIGNDNADLWKYVSAEGTVLEWMRSVVANRIATDGSSWSKYFVQFNSGTYNNQWMVVDYNKFAPGNPNLQDGLLWVVEQLPKYIVREDRTDTLRKQSYWPSYNSPYYPLIFNLSGAAESVKKFGDWFSYDKTPRAQIFRRDHVKVTDLTSMAKLMRYNDYKKDPISRCECTPPYSAENAISARSDLNPPNGTYPFPALGHRSHGGIDMKLTSNKLATTDLRFIAVAGPTWDDQPPFRWSTSDFAESTPHMGHPDEFKFDPILFTGNSWVRPVEPAFP